MNELFSFLTREVKNNLLITFTNCDKEWLINFDKTTIPLENSASMQEFWIENPYGVYEGMNKQKSPIKQRQKMLLYILFRNSITSFLQPFLTYHLQLKDFSTNQFDQAYLAKKKVEGEIFKALVNYDNKENKQKALTNKIEELEAAKRTKQLNANWEKNYSWEEQETVNTDYNNTFCTKCINLCHKGCALNIAKGSNQFSRCASFGGHNDCQDCGCSYTYHQHQRYYVIKVTKNSKDVDYKMKQEYENSETNMNLYNNQKNSLETELNKLQKTIVASKYTINNLIAQYNKLVVGNNFKIYLVNFYGIVQQYETNAESVEKKNNYAKLLKDIENQAKLLGIDLTKN